jgi:hypothetical protein
MQPYHAAPPLRPSIVCSFGIFFAAATVPAQTVSPVGFATTAGGAANRTVFARSAYKYQQIDGTLRGTSAAMFNRMSFRRDCSVDRVRPAMVLQRAARPPVGARAPIEHELGRLRRMRSSHTTQRTRWHRPASAAMWEPVCSGSTCRPSLRGVIRSMAAWFAMTTA